MPPLQVIASPGATPSRLARQADARRWPFGAVNDPRPVAPRPSDRRAAWRVLLDRRRSMDQRRGGGTREDHRRRRGCRRVRRDVRRGSVAMGSARALRCGLGRHRAGRGANAAGCPTTYATRGRPSDRPPTPCIVVSADARQATLVLAAAAEANCGFFVRDDGLIETNARSLGEMQHLALALIRWRPDFERAPASPTCCLLDERGLWRDDIDVLSRHGRNTRRPLRVGRREPALMAFPSALEVAHTIC